MKLRLYPVFRLTMEKYHYMSIRWQGVAEQGFLRKATVWGFF
ncbi:MAG: hypothetical protein CM1200mP30_34480 [Pseudomonadota bacterium]|nr:MAG: hypothetical protein CM1200mP30_34480 [Pseudomonadota bacterium]